MRAIPVGQKYCTKYAVSHLPYLSLHEFVVFPSLVPDV